LSRYGCLSSLPSTQRHIEQTQTISSSRVGAMKPLAKKANRQVSVLLRRPLSQDHERR